MALSPKVRKKLDDLLQFNEAAIANLEKQKPRKGSNGAKLLEGLRRHNKFFHKMLG